MPQWTQSTGAFFWLFVCSLLTICGVRSGRNLLHHRVSVNSGHVTSTTFFSRVRLWLGETGGLKNQLGWGNNRRVEWVVRNRDVETLEQKPPC